MVDIKVVVSGCSITAVEVDTMLVLLTLPTVVSMKLTLEEAGALQISLQTRAQVLAVPWIGGRVRELELQVHWVSE